MSSLGNSSNFNNHPGSMGAGSSVAGPSWTDSLPRRDFYSNIAPTGSLPRRDKAGLGRPEPPRPPSAASMAGVPVSSSCSSSNQDNNGLKGNNLRRRDLSLNRDNAGTFRDAFSGNKGKLVVIRKGED